MSFPKNNADYRHSKSPTTQEIMKSNPTRKNAYTVCVENNNFTKRQQSTRYVPNTYAYDESCDTILSKPQDKDPNAPDHKNITHERQTLNRNWLKETG